MADTQYGNVVPNNWSYEEEMRHREKERIRGIKNQCPIINLPQYKDRCCPSDGISKCKDCPFLEK